MLKAEDPRLCRWHPPPSLSVVRRVQQEVAAEEDFFFWDWSTLMDGECGIQYWALCDPPYASADRLHLKSRGYDYSAEILFQLLMEYYELYRSNLPNNSSS